MSLLVVLRPTIVRSDVQPMWGDRGEMYCKRSFYIDLTSTSPHVQGESKNLISKKIAFIFSFAFYLLRWFLQLLPRWSMCHSQN